MERKINKIPRIIIIAKDNLAILAFTIVSEFAFSSGKRILDEKRSCLTPHTIQIFVFKKDQDQAEVRTQKLKNDDDQWTMMDTSASSSGGEVVKASDQQDDDDEEESNHEYQTSIN